MKGIPQSTLGAYSRRLNGLGNAWAEFDDGYFDLSAQAGDISATQNTSWMDAIKSGAKTASELFTTYKTAQAQDKIIDLNARRAAMGLPPLSGSALAPTMNMGISPATMDVLVKLALGAGAVFLISRVLQRR